MPGEDLDKVFDRLHDPKDFAGRTVLVVGGGDSALETAIALAAAGAHVTLSYRGRKSFGAKPEAPKIRLEQPARRPSSTQLGARPRLRFPGGDGHARSLRIELATRVVARAGR